jgi:hypothetical protein
MSEAIVDALTAMRSWGEARDWSGYDPYDGLNSPAAAVLSLGTPLGRRLVTQAVKLSPVNLRPLLRIRPERNAKAIALVASAYARLHAATGEDRARVDARRLLAWLCEHPAGADGALAWGYHFPVQTRVFRYGRETPNTIATTFAAHALLDGAELLGDDGCRDAAVATARFLLDRMVVEDGDRMYFAYLPGERELIHNANALACAALARTGRVCGDSALADAARRALTVTLAAQRPDGSWPYADAPGHDWVDNFHTAYVLESLAECARDDDGVRDALVRGLAYWHTELFLDDGTPKYTPQGALPFDAHCYASAIDAWVAAAPFEERAIERAERTARLLVERMLDPEGYIHFQRRRLWTSRVPFVRWTTAPAFRALAGLELARRRIGSAASGREMHARLD